MRWPFALLFFLAVLLIPKRKEIFRDMQADEEQGIFWIIIGIFFLILALAFLVSFS